MTGFGRRICAILLGGLVSISPAVAQEQLIGGYLAEIGFEDMYNSRGVRLQNAATIVRQDRANFHRFRVRHAYDEGDPWFGSVGRRQAMERLIVMSPFTANIIVQHGGLVAVTVYARNGRITSIRVEVPG